jgi:hypothetical protein
MVVSVESVRSDATWRTVTGIVALVVPEAANTAVTPFATAVTVPSELTETIDGSSETQLTWAEAMGAPLWSRTAA